MGMFALMISVVFVSGVMAQQKPATTPAPAAQQSKLEKWSGTIEKVDSAKKEVFLKQGKEEMTFSLGEKAKIMEGKKELSLNDLKKGTNVSVEYKKEGNKLTAESITVSPMHVSQASKTGKKW